jgi:hypothetical protein
LTIQIPASGPRRNSARIASWQKRRASSHRCAASQPFSATASAPARRLVHRPASSGSDLAPAPLAAANRARRRRATEAGRQAGNDLRIAAARHSRRQSLAARVEVSLELHSFGQTVGQIDDAAFLDQRVAAAFFFSSQPRR